MNASPLDMLGVVVSNPTSSPSGGSSSTAFEDDSKKIRKPYTITKSRESWTEQEHDKFLEALQLFDRDWKKIEAFVGSKTVIQIRSHAQKYFLKVQKNGTGERVPPPRPKRKSVQPYPQKATKSAISSAGDWFHHTLACSNKDPIGNDLGQINTVVRGNYASNGNSSVNISHQALLSSQTTQESCTQVTPDFAEIYKFLGNVFDPNESGHLRKLKEMVPIDRETILLLMGNLSINLSNPKFEEQNLFLPMYDMSSMDPNSTATLVANKTVLLKGPAMTGCMSQSVPVVHSSPAEAALETSHQVQLLETIPENTLELAQGSQLMSSNSLVATDLRNVESPFVKVPSSSQLPTGPVNTLSFLPNGQNAIMESESEFTLGCKLLPSGGTRRETVDGWWG